jgi:lipopolysaccharide biosynthesis protein
MTVQRPGDNDRVDALAFYLPQYHPIPENDEWWEPGFTEWTNVTKARPLFRGHHQPILPGELGFYDLRISEVRERQAALAAEYGISAFCWWHYWFAGHRVLERPFHEVLDSGKPDFPFCLAWANQSWSGVWYGATDRILIEQTYPEGDYQAHFDSIVGAFRDDRYYRVDGKPLFLVFRPRELPNPAKFVDAWQKMARKAGLEGLYLVAYVDSRAWGPQYAKHQKDGFDAALNVAFPFQQTLTTRVRDRLRSLTPRFGPGRYHYSENLPDYPRGLGGVVHPCVYPNWDNTARSQRRGSAVVDATPDRFGHHLHEAVERAKLNPEGQRLVWIKSWNEWAEGNYVEPDRQFKRGWLEAVAREIGT